jgi:hypothetical protein
VTDCLVEQRGKTAFVERRSELHNGPSIWLEFLSALDNERPLLHGETLGDGCEAFVSALSAAGLLCELSLAKSLACAECAEAPFRDVIYTDAADGRSRALFPCPHCGLYEVPLDRLRRWQIDRGALMAFIGRSLSVTGSSSERIPGRLWRIGRLQRDVVTTAVWFGLHLGRRDAAEMITRAQVAAPALLLVPSRLPRAALPEGVVAGSLRELTCWSEGGLDWDEDRLTELLTANGPVSRSGRKAVPTRRKTRATDIEALVAELKQHLRAARDHANYTLATQGEPRLLPRPTQKDLARRVGITESRVSRSLNDPRATELRLLWNLADDLDQVLQFVS